MTDAAEPTFGHRVRELRESAGMSLRDLGELVFYSAPQISRIETGQSLPNLALAGACDEVFGTGDELVLLAQAEISERWTGAQDFPLGPSRFFGREEQLAELAGFLGSDAPPNVCLLHGPAGAGKTALAIRAARGAEARYPGGMFFLDLQGFSEGLQPLTADEALGRILKTLGVPGRIPQTLDDRIELYRRVIAGRRILLVLDDAVSFRQVRHLLPTGESSAALITSRYAIPALDDALDLEVWGLSEEAAVALFLHVARLNTAEPVLAAQAGRIISWSSTLPLAVRIVAAKLRSNPARTLEQAEQRLSDERSRLTELDDGGRSMQAVFASSLAALDAAPRELARLLAYHPGAHIDAWTAAALTGAPLADAEDWLESLALASMVERDPGGVYQLPDLLQHYLRQTSGEKMPQDFRTPFRRLFSSYLLSAAAADRLIDPKHHQISLVVAPEDGTIRELNQKAEAIGWLRRESAGFTALTATMTELGMTDLCWQFCYYLRGYFFTEKPWRIWIDTFRAGLTAAERLGDRAAEAQMLNGLGVALNEYGDLDEAATYFERARIAFSDVKDEHGEFNVIGNYCWLEYYRGNYEAAIRLAQDAWRSYTQAGSRRNATIALDCIGRAQLKLGRFAEARDSLEKALADYIELPARDSDIAQVFSQLGQTYYGLGDLDEAKRDYRQVINYAGKDGANPRELAEAHRGLGDIGRQEDDEPEAVTRWRAALRILDGIGAPEAAALRDALGDQADGDSTPDALAPPVAPAPSGQAVPVPGRASRRGRARILAVATEWMSGRGGISTLNRNLCIALSRAGAEVYCIVPAAPETNLDTDIARAREHGVTLVKAPISPGRSGREALMGKPRLPEGVLPDIIIGHGRVTGPEARALAEGYYPAARRFHIVHVVPDEVEWWKPDQQNDKALIAAEDTRAEMESARTAALVVAVGPRLFQRLSRDLAGHSEMPALLQLIPGFDRLDETGTAGWKPPPGNPLQILMTGRMGDLLVKGVDLAAQAIGLAMKWSGREVELLLRGVPEGEGGRIRDMVHNWAGDRSLLVAPRPFTTDSEQLYWDLRRATLLLLPSRAESFGLAALEAITLGTPALVSKRSGLGLLLQEKLPSEESGRVVVPINYNDSEDVPWWGHAISTVLSNTEAAFDTAARIHQVMSRRYTWEMAANSLLGV